MASADYDPKDEYPVLDRLRDAGWIIRYWADRQDIYVEWTSIGRLKIRTWQKFVDELKLQSENQLRVMDFFSQYLNREVEA
jgi:DNA-binding PadR family transcriptional regulator